MRIGLMGGTFNPVHYGHLVIAEAAREALAMDRVLWIPAGDPPHKDDTEMAPQEHRYAMVVLATAGHPAFEVSRAELERRGPSYAIDTVHALQRERQGAELFFITGADAILEILTWHRHPELIRACRFVAANRPGHDLDQLGSALPPEYVRQIIPLQVPEVGISSTAVRERLRRGESVRYLIPEVVEAYLRKHCLYGAGEPEAAS